MAVTTCHCTIVHTEQQGYGVCQSDEEAESWWLRAGKGKRGLVEGREEGQQEQESVTRAQNTLGMFYSRKETLDLPKVCFTISDT